MSLSVLCCYTHLTTVDRAPWTDANHCVNQFVDGLKGKAINGYAWLPVNAQKRRLENSNAGDAVKWFGEMAARFLDERNWRTPPVLIPFPDSKSDHTIEASRTKRLADSIVRAGFRADVRDILRFDAPMPSAHAEDGTRDPAEIYPHLRLKLDGVPLDKQRRYVLVDDVITTGGHLRAATAFLRQEGLVILLGVCGVKAEQDPNPDPFENVRLDLEDYAPPAANA